MSQLMGKYFEVNNYLDVAKHIQISILNGSYQPGQRLPPIRKLAVEYGVCANTISKGIAEVQKAGLILSHRTLGKIVINDIDAIHSAKLQYIASQAEALKKALCSFGFSESEIIELISTALGDG